MRRAGPGSSSAVLVPRPVHALAASPAAAHAYTCSFARRDGLSSSSHAAPAVLACLSRPPEPKRTSRGFNTFVRSDFCLTVLAPSSVSRRH